MSAHSLLNQALDALNEAESFISGFEDDELQDGIPALLQKIRNTRDAIISDRASAAINEEG